MVQIKKEEITTRSKDTVKKSTPKNKTTSNKNTSTKGYVKFVATAYCPCKQCCGKTTKYKKLDDSIYKEQYDCLV